MLQSFGVIVKERTKIEIVVKKERNHFELEDIENFLRLNEYPKTIKERGARSILNGLVKTFQSKMGNSLTRYNVL